MSTVVGAPHMAETVHLQEISVQLVHRQPAHHELVVVLNLGHLPGVAVFGDQLGHRHVEG